MKFYAIRHIKTREYMPEVRRRGYSFWNPSTQSIPNTITGTPRILLTRKTAMRCIVEWVKNPNAREISHQNYYGEWDIDLTTKPDGRKKEDLEVVEVNLKFKGSNDPYWTEK